MIKSALGSKRYLNNKRDALKGKSQNIPQNPVLRNSFG
jgi:hypothetical protein